MFYKQVKETISVQVQDIKKVLILGAGTMGQQIALQTALFDYSVCIYDLQDSILEQALSRLRFLGKELVKAGKVHQEGLQKALGRIEFSTDPVAAAQDADLVSESVPEDPELKSRVFAQFNSLCPKHTIFTTNTSSLVPSMFAQATGRPHRFAALHFHDIRITNIVDVMGHPGTDPQILEVIVGFAKAIGQEPIVLRRENFGYLFNAMLMEWLKSALSLAANGVASIEDIDRAWKGVMNYPVGPFQIMDSIGLDTVWKVTDYWARQTKDPQSLTNARFLKSYVDQGKCGVKSGEGFYSY